MGVRRGSRYENAFVTSIKNLDTGEIRKFVHDREIFSSEDLSPGSTAVDIIEGTELDFVAHKQMGRESRWWILADVNEILFPFWDESRRGDNDLVVQSQVKLPPRKLFQRF